MRAVRAASFLLLGVPLACNPSYPGLGDESTTLADAAGDTSSQDGAPALDADTRPPEPFVRDGSYPTLRSLKGVVPTPGGSREAIIDSGVGRVAISIRWMDWEPEKALAPCGAARIEHDGHCFYVDPDTDAAILAYTKAGVVVTVILDAVPAWANAERSKSCKDALAPRWCAPDDPKDFGRFVGMLASRYSDRHHADDDHGRISDWVLWPFPTASGRFDVGDPGGTDFRSYWLETFGKMFVAGHDAITTRTDGVRIYVWLLPDLRPDDLKKPARLSNDSMLDGLTTAAGTRDYRVALDPASIDVNFGPEDSPTGATFGRIGPFVGALRKRFADTPNRTQMLLLYGPFDSSPKQYLKGTALFGMAAQAEAICRAYREALSTPWIDGWVYYQHADTAAEASIGWLFGLDEKTFVPKPAWSRFAAMDQKPSLDCGFDQLPFVVLHRRTNGYHWVSTRMGALGYYEEVDTGWRLHRERQTGTHEVFECHDASKNRHYPSLDAGCEGNTPMGPLGWAWNETGPDRVELVRCLRGDGDTLVTTKPTCDPGYVRDITLGWVLPKAP